MRWFRSVGIALLMASTGAGCAARSSTPAAPATPMRGDTSMNSLDWPGAYLGTLPCADCQGIETALLLRKDNSYQLATRYLGKPGELQVQHGTFTWNAAGNEITLSGITAAPSRYLVGEGQLIQLDMQGARITGDLAARYVLQKSGTGSSTPAAGNPGATAPSPAQPPASPLQGARVMSLAASSWILTELRGKPMVTSPGTTAPPIPTLLFAAEGNRVSGNAGCNTFGGGYELTAPNRLRFSALAMTRRACPDMSIETEYSKVLAETDSYSLNGDELQLFRARMAPLAKFKRTAPK